MRCFDGRCRRFGVGRIIIPPQVTAIIHRHTIFVVVEVLVVVVVILFLNLNIGSSYLFLFCFKYISIKKVLTKIIDFYLKFIYNCIILFCI